MSSIRIRQPFAAAFAVLLLASAYLGLTTQKIPTYGQSDKGLHFVAFFLLTTAFYWILDTSRRRVIHITLVVCTVCLSIGSEFAQPLITNNGRPFDPFDIVANVVGSTLALALSSWYHKRMLERKRKNRTYDAVPGEDELGDEPDRDVELGEGIGSASLGQQETGVVAPQPTTNVSEELDNWDENDEDWEDGPDDVHEPNSKPSEGGPEPLVKKRVD